MTTVWAHLHLPRFQSADTPDVISIKVPGSKIAYVPAIEITDAEFRVHEAGRRKCVRDGVRNVHAWVVGHYAVGLDLDTTGMRKAAYSPFKGTAFVDTETLTPVYRSDRVVMIGKDVYYEGCGALDVDDFDACGQCGDCAS